MKITIYRDNTTTLEIQALHADGSVVSLAGCSLLMCFKTDRTQPNSAALFTKTTSDGSIQFFDLAHGIFRVTIYAEDTQPFPDTRFLYSDVLITDIVGSTFTIANTTTFEVKANYSRK